MFPEKWLVASFLALIIIGAAVLSLPGMTPAGIDFIDALFTAASAVCVTGLLTIDIESGFTAAGRTVILILMQLGGIGIVTLASLLLLSAQRRLPLHYELIMSSTVAVSGTIRVRNVVFSVMRLTLLIEGLGAILFYFAWPSEGAPLDRAWTALFHAVSGFCNAGFALRSDSLNSVRDDVGVNLIMMTLIVLGGFGFINLRELLARLRANQMRWSKFSLFLKVSLTMTVTLIVFGTAMLLTFEWHGAFGAFSPGEKVLAAAFQSVTTRTAGFSTVSMREFGEVSLRFMMLLMFIGAVSGSCAGGVKTGTLAVILALARAYIRNDADLVMFNRRIPRLDQRRAVVLLIASLALFYGSFTCLLLVERGHVPPDVRFSEDLILEFEAMSALGTVGLSTGVTAALSTAAKAVLIALMVIGRLGPLAVIAAWTGAQKPSPYTHPEETLPVG